MNATFRFQSLRSLFISRAIIAPITAIPMMPYTTQFQTCYQKAERRAYIARWCETRRSLRPRLDSRISLELNIQACLAFTQFPFRDTNLPSCRRHFAKKLSE